MLFSALLTIHRIWKQPRCPLSDKWIRKLWYTYTMENYSAIKKNTFESVLLRWMRLEPSIPSEVCQKEKIQYNSNTENGVGDGKWIYFCTLKRFLFPKIRGIATVRLKANARSH